MRPSVKNIRAHVVGNPDDFRWFHYECWQRDDREYLTPIDFPERSRSDHTRCHSCQGTINGVVETQENLRKEKKKCVH